VSSINTIQRRIGVKLTLKKTLAVAFLCGLAALGSSVSVASAASPWWTVGTVARPTVLNPGAGSSGVEELNVEATSGDVFIFFTNVHVHALIIQFNTPAQLLEEELQTRFPEQNIKVTGGPTAEGSHYVITLPGQQLLAIEEVFALEGEAILTPVSTGSPAGQIVISAANLGDAGANGKAQPIKIGGTLPAGLEVAQVEAIAGGNTSGVQAGPVTCTARPLLCTLNAGTLPAFAQIEMRIDVVVEDNAQSGGTATSFVEGGGGPRASSSQAITITDGATPFGIESYSARAESEGGQSDTQAGSHPFQFTTSFTVNQGRGFLSPISGEVEVEPAALTKDLNIKLPPGLLGNVTAYPRCTLARFAARECSPQSAIGVAIATINEPRALGLATLTAPVFNLEPNKGEPARFGFLPTPETPVFIDTSIRTGSDYGVTAHVSNIVQVAGFLNSDVTLWGVPGAAEHRSVRGYGCLEQSFNLQGARPCEPGEESQPKPFLRMPTTCAHQQLESTAEADSWTSPGVFVSAQDHSLPTLDGCDQLRFAAQLKASPDTQAGSSASGMDLDVHVPQESGLTAEGLVPADVQDSTVALPSGTVLNAAAAGGLQACSLEQIGLNTAADAACPDASKIATVEIKSPLIEDPLRGELYVAAQNANPFGSLVAAYLVASDPTTGVLVKLAGKVSPDPVTGQLVTTFQNTPQLPFEDLKLSFFDGSRSALATPTKCGQYTTAATFVPWSGNEVSQPTSVFTVSSGPGGTPCSNPLPLAPGFTVGTTDVSAAKFTPLTTTITRADGQQTLESVSVSTPPGLSGDLTGVPLCPEADANQGTCGAGSQIGETTVSVGVGGTPFNVTGGRVYLTEKYAGAPFGLSIVSPAKAGPYDLGEGACDCIVVRARINVDPHTAALTVSTDSTGPHKIPTILQGIPLNIQRVNVTIGRERFVFNPSNCEPFSASGVVTGTEGAVANLNSPFQVTNCAALKFAPKFVVSTGGKTSKAKGASLDVKLLYPQGPQGTYANIARVKVDLPKQLPSRLTTLQKACLAKVFEVNPAGCPAASIVGHAKAITPILPVPLEGPAYFVSHGNEAFPSLIIVLQGYGVTVDLVGTTFISKAGITSSTFKQVPDVPVGSFELNLPQGKFSALAANGNLCKSKLAMPTEFLAQNGAKINESTKVGVTGCPKVKKAKRAKKHAAARRR
jgi:hypothetical protein